GPDGSCAATGACAPAPTARTTRATTSAAIIRKSRVMSTPRGRSEDTPCGVHAEVLIARLEVRVIEGQRQLVVENGRIEIPGVPPLDRVPQGKRGLRREPTGGRELDHAGR